MSAASWVGSLILSTLGQGYLMMYLIKHRLYLLMFAPHLPQIADLSSKISELDSGVNRYQFEASEHKVSEVSYVNTKSLLEIAYTFCEYNLWIPSCNMVHPRFKCLHMS